MLGAHSNDAAVYVGYDSLVFKVRYVPFLDAEVVERQMGYDCGDFANDVEFFISYYTTFGLRVDNSDLRQIHFG